MTPEEVAGRLAERHRLCETACALMRQPMPEAVLTCATLCQGRRWEKLDRNSGVQSTWNDSPGADSAGAPTLPS